LRHCNSFVIPSLRQANFRHPSESWDPFCFLLKIKMDPSFRRDDEEGGMTKAE